MKIVYKGNIYDVSNELTHQQFLNDGGEIYENKEVPEEPEEKYIDKSKRTRGRRKRMEW